MRNIQQSLLRKLADGEFHSGEDLANEHGLTRAAIWNHVRQIADYGLDIHSVRGKGHRMARAFSPLDADIIKRHLKDAKNSVASFAIKHTIDSTNRYLVDMAPPPPGQMHVCLAEQQTGGRGRRGRKWQSPYGAGIYLSMAQVIKKNHWPIGGLSLSLGAAVHRVLFGLGVSDIKLKWPNDLMIGDSKVAGLLIEASQTNDDRLYVVMGIGINVDLPMDIKLDMQHLTPPPITLADINPEWVFERNQLIAAVITKSQKAIKQFSAHGFLPDKEYWHQFDYLAKQELRVEIGNDMVVGKSCGLADDGALIIQSKDGVRHKLSAGEVSVRRLITAKSAA